MLVNLSDSNSIVGNYLAEIRDVAIQKDRGRFRRNIERVGEILGYEMSKHFPYVTKEVTTPLGQAKCEVIGEQPVLATILRAGLSLHQGLLGVFDKADCGYISAYRKHKPDGSFEIELEYVSCPDLKGRILVISDPMLATASSLILTLKELRACGVPKEIHIATLIASQYGIDRVRAELPEVHIWTAAIDPSLNDRAYIVPGLGDAGDLAFGQKIQQ